jgi:trehalose/maltose hydrolase-like predicted phosphorylase
MHNPHIGVMQIYITPLDNAMDIVVESTIDTAVTNKGVLTEGKKRHFELLRFANFKNINYIAVETYEGKIHIGYASYLKITRNKKSFSTHKKILHFKINKGETLCFTKKFSIYTSRDVKAENLQQECIESLRDAIELGFGNLLRQHIRAWQKKWMAADITIRPNTDLQRAIRFNIYHMLICGNEYDAKVSIPARTLSGEGYRGHIFWDTEIFVFPFFVYTNPIVARNMLYYRYYTLDAARKNALKRGLKGALFSWESADTGEEATPTWHKDLDGRIVRIHTGEMECHITGDIAYATYQYYLATADEDFMRRAGWELIFVTARFWASRVEYNRIRKNYHISM